MSKTTKRGRPRSSETPTKNTGGGRFPEHVIALLDGEVERLKATNPGVRASRSSVLIGLVEANLPHGKEVAR